MAAIPHAVLAERFQEHLKGRRLKVAVFLTFCFDPGFFEQEVLPVFIDAPFSHAPTMRLVQLEEALRSVDEIAVYYDASALVVEAQSAKLDVRRSGMRMPRGKVFHPKNVLALVEDAEPNEHGEKLERLVVASMSANLTRAGWWENVECCHIEELVEGELSSIRDELRDLIARLKRYAPPEASHSALDRIAQFLRRVEPRKQRSAGGKMWPRLHSGGTKFLEFLKESLGASAYGANLEIISPYFDEAWQPLVELVQEFKPREVRVFLPRDHEGLALCDDLYSDWVGSQGAVWGELPKDMLRRGAAANAIERFVHAKVYRFFDPSSRYEALFVGSVNLTRAGHDGTQGNFESGFLIETAPQKKPDWWLSAIDEPTSFRGAVAEAPSINPLSALSVRYDWEKSRGSFAWLIGEPPDRARLLAQGVPLFEVELSQAGAWVELDAGAAAELERVLKSTSFLTVEAEGYESTSILVEERGMAQKPSILQTLSAADILRYWSLLTLEQRAAFLEERGSEIAAVARELGVHLRAKPLVDQSSIFSSFAGIFHAFEALAKALHEDIDQGRWTALDYRLLGKKHDSFGSLLEKISVEDGSWGQVERYVVSLCALQLVREIMPKLPKEWAADRRTPLRELERAVKETVAAQRRFEFDEPERRERFLSWFENAFIQRSRAERP